MSRVESIVHTPQAGGMLAKCRGTKVSISPLYLQKSSKILDPISEILCVAQNDFGLLLFLQQKQPDEMIFGASALEQVVWGGCSFVVCPKSFQLVAFSNKKPNGFVLIISRVWVALRSVPQLPNIGNNLKKQGFAAHLHWSMHAHNRFGLLYFSYLQNQPNEI